MDILMEAGAVHYVPLNTGSGRQRTNTIKEKLSLTMSRSILISLSKNSLTLLSKDSNSNNSKFLLKKISS